METFKHNQDALVLQYAAISARLLSEKSADTVDSLKQERDEIRETLGMTPEEIILAAKKLTVGQ